MWKFFDFVDKHKFAILAALGTYIALFIYFQIETYPTKFVISAWDEKTVLEKEEIELKPETLDPNEVDIMSQGEIKSFAQDENDNRKQSNENWNKNKSTAISEQQKIKDLEKQYYAQTGESQKREEIKKQIEELKNKQKNDNNSSKNKSEQNTQGGNTAYKGKTMITWELKNREPHQGNEWYVRNPGYTCGYGQNGEVYIKIKVNQNGNVVSATYVPEYSSNATSCMVEQARNYALKSRFSFSNSTSSQEGKIVYTFIAQ